MQPRGIFISFEGIDGAGKSSHIDALAEAFRSQGRSVTQTREPGGTALAEQLRTLVLHEDMDALTEALLVFAGRRDHLQRVIEPALARGDVVLCDRFTDATFAYQGHGRGFDAAVLEALERWVQASTALPEGQLRQPDMTVWFALSPEIAAARLVATRAPDRFEAEPGSFFIRVHEGYAARAAAFPQRFVRVDAAGSRNAVWQQITAAMVRRGWLAIMVASQGGPEMSDKALAPWLQRQRTSLLAQRGHAWLLHGPSGLGQYELALELARAWLCEQPGEQGACGRCTSCHAIAVRTHADLRVLLPETSMLALGWPLDEKAQAEIDDKKRKPSREIRVEAMRDAVEFVQRTSARGRGKAVLVFPAERMNAISANALLKTLEEPPGDVRFVLATGAAHLLLPTIRSRCMGHPMAWPAAAEATTWLASQDGIAQADVPALLAAAGGRPDDVLQMVEAGRNARAWRALPAALARGDASAVGGWTPVELVDALQKLCHDLLCLGQGGAPRFFAAEDLPAPARLDALVRWARKLQDSARIAEHPLNAGLMLEALVAQAKTTLNFRP